MRTEPRPTRAEVSDAATAVDQSADAIMLAGETAIGEFPVRAVETLAAIICEAERLPSPELTVTGSVPSAASRHGQAICEAAVTLATTGQAEAIVAVTREGKTARLLSCLRPRALILAITSAGDGGQPSGSALGRHAAGGGRTTIRVALARTVSAMRRPLADSRRGLRQRERRSRPGGRELSQPSASGDLTATSRACR